MVRIRGGFCGDREGRKSATQLEPKWPRSCLRQESEKSGTVQVTVAPSTDRTDGSERFSGAGANGSDLKRWTSWCQAKTNTMSSLKREATGPFAHSMLDGDVLMAVEYLDFPECAIAGCEM